MKSHNGRRQKQKKRETVNNNYIYVQKPLTDEKLARIGNHQKVSIHVSLPLDAIVGEQARGLKAEIESAVIADTTAWRLEDVSCQPYHVDSKHRIEFDVQARLERILRENEVDETVRIPFWQVMMTEPEAIDELILNRLTTNGDNLVESYDSIKLVGMDEDDLIIRVKATTQVGDRQTKGDTLRSEQEKKKLTLEERVAKVHELIDKAGFKRACIGISGGKDSAVVAALLVRALGAENVTAAIVPCGAMPDMDDAKAVCDALGLTPVIVPIRETTDRMWADVIGALHIPHDKKVREAHINATSRIRTCALRYVAALSDALLVGTTNASEWHVGYFTKGGDDAVDIEPILDLTCREVVALGKAMPEIPQKVLEKKPSDGLSGHTDEERLGVSYDAIDDMLTFGTSGDKDVDDKIRSLHRATEHKRHLPQTVA